MICGCLENISPDPGLSSGALERLTKSHSAREQVERPARITASGNSGPYIDKKKNDPPVRNTCAIFFTGGQHRMIKLAALPQMGSPHPTIENKEDVYFIIFCYRRLHILFVSVPTLSQLFYSDIELNQR